MATSTTMDGSTRWTTPCGATASAQVTTRITSRYGRSTTGRRMRPAPADWVAPRSRSQLPWPCCGLLPVSMKQATDRRGLDRRSRLESEVRRRVKLVLFRFGEAFDFLFVEGVVARQMRPRCHAVDARFWR